MERTRKWAIAILLVALLLVIGILLLPRRDEDEVSTPPPAPPILEQPAPVPAVFSPLSLPGDPRPERRRRVRREPPRVALAPLDPMWSTDLTRFQRRLLAGTKLFEIHQELNDAKSNLRSIVQRIEALRPALLDADQLEVYGPGSGDHGRTWWKTVTGFWIKCRPETLKLSYNRTGEPLGRGTYVRVWTLGARYPVAEIAAAEAILRQLESVAGGGIQNGFDVIATPRRGDEVLPFQGGYDWAVGVFYPEDEYSTVETDLRPSFRPEVLQHELIHAFCHRSTEDFLSSRFISEGLAEYLRFLEPGDMGLHVPPRRMANERARLLRKVAVLREKGAGIDGLVPPRLLELSPRSFYAIRQISYSLALAAMAYVGADPIERAFREKSDSPIVEAVKSIRWQDFIAFVEQHAREGNPDREVIVMDGEPQKGESDDDPSEDPRAIEEALESLGVKADAANLIGAEVLELTAGRLFSDPGDTTSLLDFLRAERESLVFFADRSDAMLGSFDLAEGQKALAGRLKAAALRASSRAAFVGKLHHALGRRRNGDGVRLLGLTSEPLPCNPGRIHAAEPLTTTGLPAWLSSAARDPSFQGLSVILCIAGRDEAARDKVRSTHGDHLDEAALRLGLEEHYVGELYPVESFLRAALVIDLSNGEGDALPLARALARTKHFRGLIGYWDPQERS